MDGLAPRTEDHVVTAWVLVEQDSDDHAVNLVGAFEDPRDALREAHRRWENAMMRRVPFGPWVAHHLDGETLDRGRARYVITAEHSLTWYLEPLVVLPRGDGTEK